MELQRVPVLFWGSCMVLITAMVLAAQYPSYETYRQPIQLRNQINHIVTSRNLLAGQNTLPRPFQASLEQFAHKPVKGKTASVKKKRSKKRSLQRVTHWRPELARVQPQLSKKKTGKKTVIPTHSMLRLQKLGIIAAGSQVRPAAAHTQWQKLQREGIFSWPLHPSEFWISSVFGPRRKTNGKQGFHTGVDMAAVTGTPIRASGSGIVVEAAFSPGYGNYILIRHNKKYKTRYAHLQKILVSVGQKVTAGDYIGRVGATGFVRKSKRGRSGSHLHFEVYFMGKAVNPFYFLA